KWCGQQRTGEAGNWCAIISFSMRSRKLRIAEIGRDLRQRVGATVGVISRTVRDGMGRHLVRRRLVERLRIEAARGEAFAKPLPYVGVRAAVERQRLARSVGAMQGECEVGYLQAQARTVAKGSRHEAIVRVVPP